MKHGDQGKDKMSSPAEGAVAALLHQAGSCVLYRGGPVQQVL